MDDKTKPTTPTLGDVFRRAAEEVQTRGHGKGRYLARTGEVCMIGALIVQELDCETNSAARRILYDHARQEGWDGVTRWNDEPDRTPEEVEKVFLTLADRADFAGGA